MPKSKFYHESKVPLPSPQELEELQIFINSIGLFQCKQCAATWFPEKGTDCPNPSCQRYYTPNEGYKWPTGSQAETNAKQGIYDSVCSGHPQARIKRCRLPGQDG